MIILYNDYNFDDYNGVIHYYLNTAIVQLVHLINRECDLKERLPKNLVIITWLATVFSKSRIFIGC